MNTFKLLDDRNIELWNELNKTCKIEIQEGNEFAVSSKNNHYIIFINRHNLNSASFTHELLHSYIKKKGVFIGGGLRLSIHGSSALSDIFSDTLLEHISNCLDHIKMFPEFVKLGYNAYEFITDFESNKLTKSQFEIIKQNFVKKTLVRKVYNASIIDSYIGQYFAVKACPNKSFDYSVELEGLREIDEELFLSLERLFNAWEKFDYNDNNPTTGGYNELLCNFINDLENWAINKEIDQLV